MSRGSGDDGRRIHGGRHSGVIVSLSIHLSLVLSVCAVQFWVRKNWAEPVAIEVIEHPKASPPQIDLTQQPPPKEKPPVEPRRKVFGVTKKALVADQAEAGEDSVNIKLGNTLAAPQDTEKLNESDADALPIPTDEYLVTKMPTKRKEMRIPYPPEAREKNISGKVVLDLLIDKDGRVREAKVISGPGYGLNEAAAAAILQFEFNPAERDGIPIAVRTRFVYNFELGQL